MRAAPLLAFPFVLAASGAAHADEVDEKTFSREPERRAGLVVGMSGGFGVAAASGYPNKAAEIGDPAFYAQSGAGLGSGGTFLVMAALADFLNFGIWFGGNSSRNDGWRTSAGGGGFRVEAFPLYSVAPRLRDLGVAATLGLGVAKIEAVRGGYPGAEGVQSHVGLGAFYEWRIFEVLGGHLAAGPSVDYTAVLSRSVNRHGVYAGGRLVFYTSK